MASPADVSITIQNPPSGRKPQLVDLEDQILNNFRIYTLSIYATVLIAIVGFIITVSTGVPDSFGTILLVALELSFICAAIFALKAKRKFKLQFQDFANQFWLFTFMTTLVFILYVLMVLGNLTVSYSIKIQGQPININFDTGRPLRLMTYCYFIPLHLGVLLYLLLKSLSIRKLLKERELLGFTPLKGRADTSSVITQQNKPNDISNLSVLG